MMIITARSLEDFKEHQIEDFEINNGFINEAKASGYIYAYLDEEETAYGLVIVDGEMYCATHLDDNDVAVKVDFKYFLVNVLGFVEEFEGVYWKYDETSKYDFIVRPNDIIYRYCGWDSDDFTFDIINL